MSERTMTGGQTVTYTMFRRNTKGQIVEVEPQPDEYTHPPRGTRGRFMLNGASPFYETEGQYGKQTRLQLEFLIEKAAGNVGQTIQGKKFRQSFPVPKNIADERSKLGQFFAALIGRPIRNGDDINPDDFLGTSFVTSTTLDENGDKLYAGISWETIEDGSVKLSPYVPATLTGATNATAPNGGVGQKEAPQSDGAPKAEDDPFEMSDDL